MINMEKILLTILLLFVAFQAQAVTPVDPDVDLTFRERATIYNANDAELDGNDTTQDAAIAINTSKVTYPGDELTADELAAVNGVATPATALNPFVTEADNASGGISDIVEDTTPQLGGNLDIQTHAIEGVDATEFGYVDGITSDIQTQLNAKEDTLTNSAGLRGALDDETGAGASVFNDSPTIADPTFTGEVTAGTGGIQFDISGTPPSSYSPGLLYWDTNDGTLNIDTGESDVTLQINQESVVPAKNETGVTITNGQVVYISGAATDRPTIALADADISLMTGRTIGVATTNINNTATGMVTTFGLVRGVSTTGFTAGDSLWVSGTPGVLTNIEPTHPQHLMRVGYAITIDAANGIVFVSTEKGEHLANLWEVDIDTPLDGHGLFYDSATETWKNTSSGSGTDADAIHDNVANEISAITVKGTPASGDYLIIEDSEAAGIKKHVLIGSLPTGGGGEANTASSDGTGVSVFNTKAGIDLGFNAIKSENNLLTVSLDASSHDVELTMNEANLAHPTSDGSSHADVALNTTHRGLVTGNPHVVTAADIGVESGATADQSNAEIKTAYELNADTNAFTDAEKTLLGLQSGTNTGDQDLSGKENVLVCTTGQIKKWSGGVWVCAADEEGSGSLPSGVTNDILQHDGTSYVSQGYINGLIDETTTHPTAGDLTYGDLVTSWVGSVSKLSFKSTTGLHVYTGVYTPDTTGYAILTTEAAAKGAVSDEASYDLNEFTVEYFFYYDGTSTPTAWSHSFGKDDAFKVDYSSTGYLRGVVHIGATTYTTQTLLADLSVDDHHLAFTKSNTDGTSLYIDGTRVDVDATATGTTDLNDNAVKIFGGVDLWPFKTDEMRVSNIARYSGVSFTPPTSEFTSDANTISLWHFNEGTGTIMANEGTAADMTLSGTWSLQETETWK